MVLAWLLTILSHSLQLSFTLHSLLLSSLTLRIVYSWRVFIWHSQWNRCSLPLSSLLLPVTLISSSSIVTTTLPLLPPYTYSPTLRGVPGASASPLLALNVPLHTVGLTQSGSIRLTVFLADTKNVLVLAVFPSLKVLNCIRQKWRVVAGWKRNTSFDDCFNIYIYIMQSTTKSFLAQFYFLLSLQLVSKRMAVSTEFCSISKFLTWWISTNLRSFAKAWFTDNILVYNISTKTSS